MPRKRTLKLSFYVVLSLLFMISKSDAEPSFLQKIQLMRQQNKMPGLAADGVIVPQALLFDQLKKMNNTEQTVQSLSLTPRGGQLKILAHKAVDVELTVNFQVQGVDWEHRTVYLTFQEATQSASQNSIGRLLGNLVISSFEVATGAQHVKAATDKLPYINIDGQDMAIHLDKVPQLQDTLNQSFMGFKLFDSVGIKTLIPEQGHLRVRLGMMRSTAW